VNEQIRLIVELQKLDTEIIARDRTIKGIPLRISSMEKPLKEAEARAEAEKAKLQAAEKKKRDRERDLDESSAMLQKLRERTALIKDNKAYQAHLKEIEASERASRDIEDSILDLMEEMETEGRTLRAAEEALKKEREKADELRRQLDAEVAEARQKLSGIKSRRSEFTSRIEGELYGTYMSLLKTLGGVAVTEARDEVCTGCNMHIMPQLFVEIKKNEEVIHCPQCRRILYFRDEAGAPG